MKKLLNVTFVAIVLLILSGCAPANEVLCGEGTELVDGECVAPIKDENPVECGEGTILVDGQCLPDQVEPLVCNEGYHEEDGACVEDEEPLVCDEGYHMEFGACVEDEPAQTTTCETDLNVYGNDASYYEMVWSDEFDYEGQLDDSKWEYLIGNGGSYGIPGWGNNELQYYTNSLDNVKVENGVLKITASTDGYAQYDYTSGRVRTMNHGDYTYGVFEVCAKMPNGLGTWPAIWMLPTNSPHGGWPYGGEIDIMEAVGFENNIVHWNIHTKAYNWNDNQSFGNHGYSTDIYNQFHKYAVLWEEDSIEFYVDGVLKMTYAPDTLNDPNIWPFDNDFHIILNIAVGGAWGGQRGIQEGDWSTTMEVDYVRIYQDSE